MNKALLPNSIEAERIVLGGLMLDGSLFPMIRERLSPDDFYTYHHKEIYETMIKIWAKKLPITVQMLIQEGKYDRIMELELYNMAIQCPSVNNLRAYADIIREKSVQRQLVEASKYIPEKKQQSGDINWSDYLERLAQRTESLHNSLTIKPSIPCKDLRERLALYFEETAAEIRTNDVDEDYLQMLSLEMNRAITCAYYELDDLEDKNATN